MAEIQKVQDHEEAELNRRQFIERSSSAALAVGVLPTVGLSGVVRADEAKPVAETAVTALYQTLTRHSVRSFVSHLNMNYVASIMRTGKLPNR